MVLHPSMDEKGMMTMRLHRLHFSSKRWPRTFAISWPHSQRVSDASAGVPGEGRDMCECFLDIENNY
jgi:hypothetical protein